MTITLPQSAPGGEDTIVALSTAPGRSAIAVVRLSGPTAFAVAGRVVTPWPLSPRQSTLCQARDPEDHSVVDRLIVTTFAGPRSYTGEDTVEFSTHGGYAVPEALVRTLLSAGARQALPGEFTKRALLNGKLDLVQAEAVGDLIDASSDSMRRLVLHQLDGGLSRQIEELRSQLLHVEALLAYDIDFPEEDSGPVSRTHVSTAASAVSATLDALLRTAPLTELVREGAVVVIAGRPNVGKSSLFNALLGETRAIVTDVPGTTRDAIEARVNLGNWPVRIVDTAGLRATDEIVERLGIEVSQRYLEHAHAVLVCDDEMSRIRASTDAVAALTAAPIIPVLTKSDREPNLNGHAGSKGPDTPDVVHVSAHTRAGLATLTSRLRTVLDERYGVIPVARPALTRVRHRIAIQQAQFELREFQRHWDETTLPASVAAVHVRAAVGALDELIGAVDVDDVLGRVFATFCVGK